MVYYIKRTDTLFILYTNSDGATIADFGYTTEQADRIKVNVLLRHGYIERLGIL